MRNRIAIAALFLPLLMTLDSSAQQPTSQRSDRPIAPQLGAVDRAIAQFEEDGLGAVRSFLRGGRASAPLLRKVLDRDNLPTAVRDLADRALVLCQADGPVTNGLTFGFAASAKTLRVGESVKLTVTLCNVSDHEIEAAAGMSYAGNRFGNGSLIHLVGEDGTPAMSAGFSVGFCGTGATRLVEKIRSLDYRRFEVELEYQEAVGGFAGFQPHTGRFLNFGVTQILLPDSLEASGVAKTGEHGGELVRLRMRYAVEASDQPEASAKEWSGVLTSAELALELLPAKS